MRGSVIDNTGAFQTKFYAITTYVSPRVIYTSVCVGAGVFVYGDGDVDAFGGGTDVLVFV